MRQLLAMLHNLILNCALLCRHQIVIRGGGQGPGVGDDIAIISANKSGTNLKSLVAVKSQPLYLDMFMHSIKTGI